ncbi:mitochondrial carrier [Penicillium angulare]|uniref:Mitochondrial carrier n=1 Tax=Penicillium angulare TaxID=116970 RepID=A0A9W9G7W2_9EURO|nr:mitochondrial carrier [Penicillium angulare]
MSSRRSWFMDEDTRNSLLKRYQTQVASGASTICATLSLTPLENVKTRMQTHNFKNVGECMRYLWRTEGPRGYVAGALPPLISVTVVRVVNFTAYNWTKVKISDQMKRLTGISPLEEYYKRGSLPTFSQFLTFSLAGGFAGLIASPLACPFELAKNVVQTSVLVSNRDQAAPGAAHDSSLRHKPRLGTIGAIQQIVRRYGVRGLYTGFRLHVMRDTLGSGFYFSIYEHAKQLVAYQMGPRQNGDSRMGAPLVAGAVCSTIPWFLTYPLDTRKTRAQSILLGKSKEIGEASVAVAKSSMYKGISIILLRTSINNMILLSLYETIMAKIHKLP